MRFDKKKLKIKKVDWENLLPRCQVKIAPKLYYENLLPNLNWF